MNRLTRIQAINEILKIKTSERVTTVDELDTIPQAVSCGEELDISTLDILTEFKWFFNFVDNGQLTADNDGYVTLPDNLSYVTFHSSSGGDARNLRPVAGRAYDTYNHTDVLGVGVTVRYEGWLVWDFADLPYAFQKLAIAHARLRVCGSSSHISPARYQIEKLGYSDALQTAEKFDDTLSGGRINGPTSWRRRGPRNHGWV